MLQYRQHQKMQNYFPMPNEIFHLDLYEGSFSPTHANGKRVKHNVYAETREEVEVKLAELIERVREEIAGEKAKMKEDAD